MGDSFINGLAYSAARGVGDGLSEAMDAKRAAEEARTEAEKAYTDRNLLALSMAVNRKRIGCDAGFYFDDEGSDWPVVWVVLPTGQASWHVPPDYMQWLEASCLSEEEPVPGYDGHDRETKNKRLLNDAVGRSVRIGIDDNVRGQ
ncbi:hypothetical protein [Haloarchaeobius sp. DFWS5]|uniref:hypothetical protein n=1 Tax=Haloarchaeobius sp. DFWS5 TaxID=3446114 RepID=UPI003EB88ED4